MNRYLLAVLIVILFALAARGQSSCSDVITVTSSGLDVTIPVSEVHHIRKVGANLIFASAGGVYTSSNYNLSDFTALQCFFEYHPLGYAGPERFLANGAHVIEIGAGSSCNGCAYMQIGTSKTDVQESVQTIVGKVMLANSVLSAAMSDWNTLANVPSGFIDGVDNYIDDDSDPTNEIQLIEISGDSISITGGNTLKLPSAVFDYKPCLYLFGDTLQILDGNYVILDKIGRDSIKINGEWLANRDSIWIETDTAFIEYTVTESYNILYDLIQELYKDTSATNEIQAMSLLNDTLFLENGGKVYLGDLKTDDDQQLTLSETTLYLEDGGMVDLSYFADPGTDDQAIDVDLVGNILTISLEDGGEETIDLSSLSVDTDEQILSLSGDTVYIENGNSIYLGYLLGTDDQTIDVDLDESNILRVSVEDGGIDSVDLSSLSNIGTDDQQISFSGDTVYLEDGGDIYLGSLIGTDDQAISMSLNPSSYVLTVSIEDGGSETVNLSSLKDEAQSLSVSLSGTQLTFAGSESGSVSVDLAQIIPPPQTIYFTDQEKTTIGISNGNTLDLPEIYDVDVFQEHIDSNLLLIAGKDTFEVEFVIDESLFMKTISEYQNLVLNGNQLEITGANTVDLSSIVPEQVERVKKKAVLNTDSWSPNGISINPDADKYDVFLNGVMMDKVSSPAHIMEYRVLNNTIYFYEDLDSDTVVYVGN